MFMFAIITVILWKYEYKSFMVGTSLGRPWNPLPPFIQILLGKNRKQVSLQ